MSEVADSARAEQLRGGLVDELVTDGVITSREVETAFRAVPRHLFAPGATLEEAYAQDRLVTKRDEHGITISSVSAPQIQAMMLEQAELGSGMRVLEIGSGGYNAALMAELVGPDGEVTTIDIDPDVVDRARRCLNEAGYSRVNVVLADGEQGCAERAPFDRIMVTVGAWDIPSTWVDQLTEGGSLTVPLRMRGLTRSITFTRVGDHLESRSAKVCGFVAMQGAGEHRERLLLLRDKEIGLRFDDDWPADPDLLNGAFEAGQAQVWSGVTVGRREPFDTLQLWLATTLDGFCLLSVDKDLDSGLVRPVNRIAAPAVVEGTDFAYLTVRGVDETTVEFGAHAFGPAASGLAKRLAEQVQSWDRDHRAGPGPRFAVYPGHIPAERLPAGLVITKRHVHVTISWPSTQPAAAEQGDL
ncbi:methyltransferase, FxLD system [Actinomadura miaoliensis]|uniref:Protein-L-isoaspartate O-methyltransferase n=1 Tax=Actinomadura miaoliensis TaxID=430685 RepID=A0ABP7X126_9ACTN